jgi:hypothetical protein
MIMTRDGRMKTLGTIAVAGVAVLGLVTLIAPPVAPAQAQAINLMPELRSKTPDEIERERRIEEAYKAKLRTIPDAQKAEPWGNVRGEAPKQAKPSARAGNRDVDWGALGRKP